jgi:hypothetical protein
LSGSAEAEAFYTPKEFEFALEDVQIPIPGARVAKRVRRNGDGEFQFEIAHRLCGKNGVKKGLDHVDAHDDCELDEAPTKPGPDSAHDHGQIYLSLTPSSPPPPASMHNYYDSENERTQLASWLKQCPSLQTVAFLSGAEWCFLAEGVGGGVWVNSFV